jgi:hypothetical protein
MKFTGYHTQTKVSTMNNWLALKSHVQRPNPVDHFLSRVLRFTYHDRFGQIFYFRPSHSCVATAHWIL